MQRLAKCLQTERLHVVLDIRVGLTGVTAGEGPQLAGCHAHGAAALERVFQGNHGLAPQELAWVLSVLTPCTLNTALICRWSCKLAPTPGASCSTLNAITLHKRPAHARELQQLRRANAAGAQNHLGRGAGTHSISPPLSTCTPVQRKLPSPCGVSSSRATWAWVHTCKLARPLQAGRKNALAVFQRQPARWLTSNNLRPRCCRY
jgi:hypothetical protein